MGGRPVDVAGDQKNARRTVYGMVDRQSLPAVFRAFDFASPDQSAERRPRTTVPQQALFAMNAPFVIEQARSLAGRLNVPIAQPQTEARVAALYHAALARSPAPAGGSQGTARFLSLPGSAPSGTTASSLSRTEQFAQVLIMTNELLFIDLKGGGVGGGGGRGWGGWVGGGGEKKPPTRGRVYHEKPLSNPECLAAGICSKVGTGMGHAWVYSGCWVISNPRWERPLKRGRGIRGR